MFDLSAYASLDSAELTQRIEQVRRQWGPRLLILGHHYQRDEVIELCDLRGDSYQLARMASENDACRAIVFCGVHFMAETADILANAPDRLASRGGQRVPVLLPDLAAGCALADMADAAGVENCWRQLSEVIDTSDVTPITYVNSTAALKAFCGRHGGVVCTSANARAALDWAFARRSRVLFFPDQHLARNTAKSMGIRSDEMPLWEPTLPLGGNSIDALRDARVILWNGCCCVHQKFLPQHVDEIRAKHPGIRVIVHPECMNEVVERADDYGSTGKIIEAVEHARPGTRWAIGTERNLVMRLKRQHPEQEIVLLSPDSCLCETMNLIDLPKLCWTLENLAAGTPTNVIAVEPETARGALESLRQMLAIS